MTPIQGEPPTPVFLFPERKQRHPGPAQPNYAIPQDQWPDILRRVEQGEAYRLIAQDYQTSQQTIRRIVETAHGKTCLKPLYAILREQWDDVLQRVDRGESYRQIAKHYHVAPDTVRRMVQSLRPGPVEPKFAIPRHQWPDILRRVAQGESQRQIARTYGVARETIRRVLRALHSQQGGEA